MGRRCEFQRKHRQRCHATRENVSSLLAELQVELKGKNVIICNTQLHVWLKKMESRVKKHGIFSALSFEHRKAWVEFFLDQASRFRKKFRTGRATIHIDDAWFYFIRDGHNIRMLPGKEELGSIKLQHKSHVPKVTIFWDAVEFRNTRTLEYIPLTR